MLPNIFTSPGGLVFAQLQFIGYSSLCLFNMLNSKMNILHSTRITGKLYHGLGFWSFCKSKDGTTDSRGWKQRGRKHTLQWKISEECTGQNTDEKIHSNTDVECTHVVESSTKNCFYLTAYDKSNKTIWRWYFSNKMLSGLMWKFSKKKKFPAAETHHFTPLLKGQWY